MIWRVLRQEKPLRLRGLVQSIRAPVNSLEKALGRELSLDQVKNTLTRTFCEVFDASVAPQAATGREVSIAADLLKEKYSREEWNLRK
jgi:lipoate-protein ligase A